MSSLRDQVRNARAKIHPVPTDDGVFYVRAFDGTTRQKYVDIVQEADGKYPFGRIAALGLCEADGTAGYDPDNEDDVREVAAMNTPTLDIICRRLQEVSGLTAKAGDDAEKKSDASPTA